MVKAELTYPYKVQFIPIRVDLSFIKQSLFLYLKYNTNISYNYTLNYKGKQL